MEKDKPSQKSSLIKQVIQRDLEWAQAHIDLNLELIDQILSEEHQQRQPDGTYKGKAELLESYSSGNRYWEIANSKNHHVQLAGNLAILIGNWRGKGVNNGEPFDYSARFLSIYKLEDGIWRMTFDVSIPSDSYI